MPSRHQRQIAFLIGRKKAAASRSYLVLLAGFLALVAYVWANDNYLDALRFFLFLFPHIFLFLSQDMFREEIESGALENILFLDGRFRGYLLDKNLVLGSIGLALSAALFIVLAVFGIASGEFSAIFLLQFAVGTLVGVYYLLAGGLLSFFFKGGSNVLVVILGQVLFVIGLFFSATRRTGLIDLLTANDFPGAAAKFKLFLLSLLLPNLAISKRLPAVLLGLAAIAVLLWIIERRKIASVEIAKR